VAGAHVSLTGSDGSPRQSVMSGAGGAFTFSKLLPGFYVVLVQAKGFAIFTSGTLVVTAQQTLEMPPIALEVGSTSTDVEVRPTEVIAAEQIKQEEKQRVLGIIPNFYISYTWNAAPMTTKQKYSMAAREEFDWTSFVGAGFAAGLEQANNSFAGYGQGAAGYGKRYAAAFGNGLFTNFFSHAVYPSIFHQDPRYYYQGSGTIKSRALRGQLCHSGTQRQGTGCAELFFSARRHDCRGLVEPILPARGPGREPGLYQRRDRHRREGGRNHPSRVFVEALHDERTWER